MKESKVPVGIRTHSGEGQNMLEILYAEAKTLVVAER
jgi:hypothetical protein